MPLLIQGLFFQNYLGLGLGVSPEGPIAVIRSGLGRFMYSGVIWQDPEYPHDGFVGQMWDNYGASELSDVLVYEDEVGFTKKYERRADLIRYTFRVRESQTWFGEYEGKACGKGTSSCILTDVPDGFFQPEFIMGKLGLIEAHRWPT
ncbi:MAG: hypothetical protein AAB821_00135 [Patescibacteria group bacterium]